MFACLHVCLYECMYVCTCVCMCVCMSVCMYVCMYVSDRETENLQARVHVNANVHVDAVHMCMHIYTVNSVLYEAAG